MRLKGSLIGAKTLQKAEIQGTFSMDCRELVYHTQCVSHTGYLARGNSKGEERERSRHKNSGI